MSPSKLGTEAWLLLGISSIPGALLLKAGQLSFTAQGTGSAWPWQLRKLERRMGRQGLAAAVDAGQATLVFDWPASEVGAWCPWYYFGGGIKISRSQATLRISFGEPAHMKLRAHQGHPGGVLREAAAQLHTVGVMRSRGKLWQAALKEHARPRQRDV